LILLEENNSKAIAWAAAIIVSRGRLFRLVHENAGPFVVNVAKETDRLVNSFRKLEAAEIPLRRTKRTKVKKAKTLAS